MLLPLIPWYWTHPNSTVDLPTPGQPVIKVLFTKTSIFKEFHNFTHSSRTYTTEELALRPAEPRCPTFHKVSAVGIEGTSAEISTRLKAIWSMALLAIEKNYENEPCEHTMKKIKAPNHKQTYIYSHNEKTWSYMQISLPVCCFGSHTCSWVSATGSPFLTVKPSTASAVQPLQ